MNELVRAGFVGSHDESAAIKSGRAVHSFDARARPISASPRNEDDTVKRFCLSIFGAAILGAVVITARVDHASAQEIALTPLQATEVARGYRAEALKLKPVVNERNETIGRINDFIFGKDGNIYAVLAVGDFTGLSGQLVAVPFRSFKLGDSSGYIVLPGANRAALEKLPVFNNR